MANKEINELTAASLPLDLSELIHLVQSGNSRKATIGGLLGEIKWLGRAIGEPFPIWDHITGADTPPTNSANYRFIKLTAGLTGSGQYNEGVLTSESNTGAAPLVVATAVINDAASPMDGESVSLINTERRLLRAGSSGTVEQDAFQGHDRTGFNHDLRNVPEIAGSGSVYRQQLDGTNTDGGRKVTNGYASDGTSGTPRVANETRGKNIGAAYYMRIR